MLFITNLCIQGPFSRDSAILPKWFAWPSLLEVNVWRFAVPFRAFAICLRAPEGGLRLMVCTGEDKCYPGTHMTAPEVLLPRLRRRDDRSKQVVQVWGNPKGAVSRRTR
jgi:hypothetical protein